MQYGGFGQNRRRAAVRREKRMGSREENQKTKIKLPKINFPRIKTPIYGITRRWMLNNVLIIFLFVLIAIAAVSLAIGNYYYSGMSTALQTKARTASDFFSNYITRTYTEYYNSAYRYIEDFDEKNTIELQFVNLRGSVTVSSYGLAAGLEPGTPDITHALESKKMSTWTGKDPSTGERVLCVSSPLLFSNGQTIGVMRYVTSLKVVDKAIMRDAFGITVAGIAIMLLILMTNMFFIRSVVEPVNEITRTVRRIADGSFGLQINKKYMDEIGVMADSINALSMKISQSEKAQTEFVSSVSHELRTPLTAITGWAETLEYGENLDEDSRKGIDIILKESRRLTKMVEELLEFTRMQDGRFTLNVEPIDVGAELEESIFTYRELLKQDEIELEYEPCMEELPLVNGDPLRLRQVFLNIIDNAAKYAREGKKIIVNITFDSSYVTVAIRDFGNGIPEDELEHVKKKFYKGSNSKERGSGIGLAVCDEIIRYHGGELVLENAAGGGLIVKIMLPIGDVG